MHEDGVRDSRENEAQEVREFLQRLSRDKRAVTAHLGIRMDLEHKNFLEPKEEKERKNS